MSLPATKQALIIKLATTVGRFYVTLTLITLIWLDHLDVFFLKIACKSCRKWKSADIPRHARKGLGMMIKERECTCHVTRSSVASAPAGHVLLLLCLLAQLPLAGDADRLFSLCAICIYISALEMRVFRCVA